MRVFGLLSFFLSLPLLAATEITTQIHDIDYGTKPGDEVLVLLTSGHVAKLHHSNKSLFGVNETLKAHRKKWYRVTIDDDRYITSLEASPAPFALRLPHHVAPVEKFTDDYVPTTIKDMDTAKKYFREARYNPKESQCFNRAMVWTYEWWKAHSLKSRKVLIFFTRNFIRRFNFEWWFHIAPLVYVMENGKVVEKVMDRKYTSGPLDMLKWAKIFLRGVDPTTCPMITRYSEYADYPYTGNCMLTRTHMFTYQPADLQMYEAWGYHKEAFNMDEVRGAYLEAFDEHI